MKDIRASLIKQISPEQLTEAVKAGPLVARPTPLTQKARAGYMEAVKVFALNPR
jgi:hypothetical protein